MSSDSDEPAPFGAPQHLSAAALSQTLEDLETWSERFEWAAPSLLRLIQIDPSLAGFFAKASPLPRHFVGLCLMAVLTRQQPGESLETLVPRIRTKAREALLSELWGRPIASLAPLGKLTRPWLHPQGYIQLAALLTDPQRYPALAALPRINPLQLERLFRALHEDLIRFGPELVASLDPGSLHLLPQALQRLRPDLPFEAILDALTRRDPSLGLAGFLVAFLKDYAFPDPPWSGDGMYKHLATPRAVQESVKEQGFEAPSAEAILDALHGLTAFYSRDGDMPCLIRLKCIPLFKVWVLSRIDAPHGQDLPHAAKRAIERELYAQGFPTVSTPTLNLAPTRGW